MVIITDANGNIQAPTIPENVYQGSNLANEIVFLAPLAQSNSVVITFRKPNGVLVEELPMTSYTSVPSNYNLSAWRYVLEDVITELYGQVTFQIKVRNGQGTVITSVGGTFPVLRGVPSIPSSDPSTSKWQAILDYVASIQADIDNGWLEARGLLPYHEDFEYSIGASVFDKETKSIYTSLFDNNVGNPLNDTLWWGQTKICEVQPEDVQEIVDAAITTHNNSATAHQTLFNNKQDKLSQAQLDAVNSGITAEKIQNGTTDENPLVNQDFVNSSIATNTANFIGTFENVPDLLGYSGTITNNDYAFVVNSVITDNGNDWATFAALDAYDKDLVTDFDYAWVENGAKFDLYRFDITTQTWEQRATNIDKADITLNTQYNRYKYNDTTEEWIWEYPLNNSSFTASQWAAINSGITSGDVAKIAELELNKQDKLTAGTGIIIDSNNVISATDQLPSHTSADVNKVLTVDSNNDIGWNYPKDEFVMFTKTNSSGTFALTSAEWASAMNNDKAILRVTDGTDYYVLYKVKYDAATVYFEGDGKEAQFIKDGVNYSGTFDDASGGNAVTLGTETQEFEGNKILKVSNNFTIARKDDDRANFTIYTSTNTNNRIALNRGVTSLEIYFDRIAKHGTNHLNYYFPSQTGTLALTSDIPTAMTNQEIDDIMDAILV